MVDNVSTAHPDLRKQLAELELVHASILAYNPRTARPPVLDSSVDALPAPSQTLPGLRPFHESVLRDKEALAGFLADPHVAELPPLSTNAPYLISVWKEVLAASASGPILAVGKTFFDGKPGRVRQAKGQGGKSAKDTGVKVDVVAEDGRSWIRVNTTKNSRLLAEFREIDSYDTGSESEDEHGRPSLAQTQFDNSLLSAGRALFAAAHANPFPAQDGPRAPDVTLRLTRLDPSSSDDKRIAHTVDLLRDMGMTVLLGDRPDNLPVSSVTGASTITELVPTTRVNLDLSILIAFISDLTHAALPATTEEAEQRFVPSASYIEWKRSRLRTKRGQDGEDDADAEAEADDDLIKHSRALAEQQKQEMTQGLLHEVHKRLSMSSKSADLSDVEFWTTKEARDRCLRIVAKIGGPDERRRVEALFPSGDCPLKQAEQEYWRESRYPVNFLPLLPIRIYPTATPEDPSQPTSQFAAALEATCRDLLVQGPTDNPKQAPPPPTWQKANGAALHSEEIEKLSATLDNTSIVQQQTSPGDEIGRASVTRANPKLTEHTVHSMLWGAACGSTTLTANRASVKAFLREMRVRGLGTGGVDALENDSNKRGVEDAVIWTVDPRSLAEGMRSDFTTQ